MQIVPFFFWSPLLLRFGMKRKQPSSLVRVRYSAVPPGPRDSHDESSSNREAGISPQVAAIACPAVMGARKDSPALHTTSRGNKAAVSGAAGSQDSRDYALQDLRHDMHAQSALGSPASLLSSWLRFHHLWSGSEVQPLLLTTFKIYAVGAMLKAGGYRSAPNFLSRAKEEHVVLGFVCTDELRLAIRKTSSRHRSSSSIAAVGSRSGLEGRYPLASRVCFLSRWRQILDHCVCLFCTREIELSLALRQHVSFSTDIQRVTWHLPCSKTDPRAKGKFLSWDCVCEGDTSKPCAFHALQTHCQQLDEMFLSSRSVP